VFISAQTNRFWHYFAGSSYSASDTALIHRDFHTTSIISFLQALASAGLGHRLRHMGNSPCSNCCDSESLSRQHSERIPTKSLPARNDSSVGSVLGRLGLIPFFHRGSAQFSGVNLV